MGRKSQNKVGISATVDVGLASDIEILCLPKNQNRSFSNMVETLLQIGLRSFKEEGLDQDVTRSIMKPKAVAAKAAKVKRRRR